jgi:hypothetical protein
MLLAGYRDHNPFGILVGSRALRKAPHRRGRLGQNVDDFLGPSNALNARGRHVGATNLAILQTNVGAANYGTHSQLILAMKSVTSWHLEERKLRY